MYVQSLRWKKSYDLSNFSILGALGKLISK